MRKLAFIFFVLFGIVNSVSAKQIVKYKHANTEEEKADLINACVQDMESNISLGWEVVSFSFTENGYVIVYEDFSDCINSVDNNNLSSELFGDFNQEEWEKDVTDTVIWADFTKGKWQFFYILEKPDGNKTYKIGEIEISGDIIGSDYNRDVYLNFFTYTKIAEFTNDGSDYHEYNQADMDFSNNSEFKLYMLNRSSGGKIDKTVKIWSESNTVTTNADKTKYKTYSEEWALANSKTDEFGIFKTTYFFEKME